MKSIWINMTTTDHDSTPEKGSILKDPEITGDNSQREREDHGQTSQDRADMSRMGKVQQLRRNYRPLSALAFTVILQGVWEVLLT